MVKALNHESEIILSRKEFMERWSSKCPRDYKHHHFFERRGILMISGFIYCIWECSQCNKCIRERLEFM